MAGKKAKQLTLEEKLQNALVPKEEQPYKIPDNWCWTYIHNIAIVVTGKTPSKKNKEYYGGKFPFFKPADLDAGRNMQYATEYLSEKGKSISVIIPEKATGICCIGTIGKCGYFLVEGTTNQQINTVISKINPLYSYYFFNTNSFVRELISKASATTIAIVNKSKLESCLFPVAPLNEQQRIVNIIESLFNKLDKAKELIEHTLNQIEQNKMVILHKAFTGELTTKWRKENNIDLSSWQEINLGKLLLPMKTKKPTDKYFRYIDIDAIDNKNQKVKSPKLILSEKAPSRASREIQSGDILFSMVRPYLKNIALINEELSDCIASTGFYVCRCKEKLLSKYLYYLLCSDDSINYLMLFMKGDNSPSIRKNDLLGMNLKLPTIEEQQEIVNILDKLLAKYNKIQNLNKQLEQIELLKKSILAKAFRGELGTNDPQEESAEKLLAEILAEN